MPAKVVVLEKVTATHGSLPVGHIIRWDYKTTSPTEARIRASRALVRDHPDENPVDWKEVA